MRNHSLPNSSYIRLKRKAPAPRYLEIGATRNTPRVEFLPDKGYLMIEGVSSPKNASVFYDQVLRKLYEYKNTENTKLSVNLNLRFFNTASSKSLWNLFKILSYLKQNDTLILINWFYEDMDMLEAGRDFGLFFDLQVNLVPITISKDYS